MAEVGRFDCVIDMICYKPGDAGSVVRAFRGQVGQLIFCSTVDVYTKPARLYPVTAEAERQPRIPFLQPDHRRLAAPGRGYSKGTGRTGRVIDLHNHVRNQWYEQVAKDMEKFRPNAPDMVVFILTNRSNHGIFLP
jgi:hypothetical protein